MPVSDRIISAFPKQPWAVRFSGRDWMKLALGVGVGTGMLAAILFVIISYAPGILRDSHVFKIGDPVTVNGVDGDCTTKASVFMFTWCELDLYYTARDGKPREAKVAALVFGGLNHGDSPTAKVDPQNPEEVSLSWFADVIPDRWLSLAGACGMFAFLGILILAGVLRTMADFLLYRKLGQNSQLIAVRLTGFKAVSNPDYAHKYSFVYGAAAQERQKTQTLRLLPGNKSRDPREWQYEAPIFLDADQTEALALVDPSGRALLVKRNFSPFVFLESEKKAITFAYSHQE